MLKIGGKCAIVLPDGQDLTSKSNKTLVAVREYLMKTCDLKEINYLPSGIFTYTNIKTCVFYFVKKREGTDVLETKVKVSKTQKETGRDYKFSKTHQTTTVKFYDYNPYEDVKNLLVEVPIDIIATNSYSLNYAEYMKDDNEEETNTEIVVKTLGELFHITKGTLQSSKNIEGEYTFITASDTYKTHNSFTHTCECVMLVGGAEVSLAKAQYFNGTFIASDLLYILIRKITDEINYKYIWYYLNFNKEKHLLDNTICCGTPKKMISMERCSNIKIPIPSLKRQQQIVKYLDFIYEKAIKTSKAKIEELKTMNEFRLINQESTGRNIVKTLSEVCEIQNGTRIVKEHSETGTFPVYGSGRAMFYTNSFNREGYNILIGRFALSLECVRFINEQIFLNDSGLSVKPKTDILLHKYIGYYLLHNQSVIYKCARGTAQKNLDMDEFKSIKIPIPSLKRQQQIVKYLDFIYEKAIKTSKAKIEELKTMNEFRLINQESTGRNIVKTLSEVCEIQNGTRIVKEHSETGTFPVYGSGRAMFYTNSFNREGYNILIGRFALSLECVRFINEQIFLNDSGLSVKPKTDILLHKYIGYYLLHNQSVIYKCARGTAQKNLDMDEFKSIKIPIPSLKRQKEIVEYCEANDVLIKQLEKDIENNKKQGEEFLREILQSHLDEIETSHEEKSKSNQEVTEDETTAEEPQLKDTGVEEHTILTKEELEERQDLTGDELNELYIQLNKTNKKRESSKYAQLKEEVKQKFRYCALLANEIEKRFN